MNLKTRWVRLMADFGLPRRLETYNALIDAYSEPHRNYHSTGHLEMVLQQLDNVEQLAMNKHEIELALWFHDAVYEPFSSSNELHSANWADKFLQENGTETSVIERVNRLIMATSHMGEANSHDEKLIVDIDLSILGQSEKFYECFAAGVRMEYKRVPRLIYRWKRKKLLRSFLAQNRIYNFKVMRDAFENQARDNIQSEIANL